MMKKITMPPARYASITDGPASAIVDVEPSRCSQTAGMIGTGTRHLRLFRAGRGRWYRILHVAIGSPPVFLLVHTSLPSYFSEYGVEVKFLLLWNNKNNKKIVEKALICINKYAILESSKLFSSANNSFAVLIFLIIFR